MEERQRADGFEATFVVATSREDAWKRLASATPAADWLPQPREGQWWIPCIEGAGDELDVVPEERLHVRKATQPCAGTETVITLEDEDTGTRITIVQHGFGAGFDSQRPWLAAGWYSILADFVVFFERGVMPGRHLLPWATIGCDVTETPSGLVVTGLAPDGFASRAGVEVGDLLLTIAGSPALTIRDLAVLMRGPLRAGDELRVRVLRGDEVVRAASVF
jgi:hypothetical protein